MIEWLTPDWPVPANVRALSTLRGGGTSTGPYASLNLADHVGDAPSAVAANRRRLAAAAGLPAGPVWLEQVHGARVVDLDAGGGTDPAARRPAADGSVTRSAGRVCAILTADCLPVLFADEDGRVVGAAHAGWRGLAAGVIEATVGALGVPPAALFAWLGPAIGPARFEVGPEVRAALLEADPEAGPAFAANSRGRFLADLRGLARRRLERLGVERIHGAPECTHERPERFFSHRRDGCSGRQATLIWLEPTAGRDAGKLPDPR